MALEFIGYDGNDHYCELQNIIRTTYGEYIAMDDGTDTFGYYNSHGSPEGVITANYGSLCVDTTNGFAYIKQSDGDNINWTRLASSFIWNAIGSSQNLVVNNGYNASFGGALVLTLPASSSLGDVIKVTLTGSTSFQIAQNVGQTIRIGNQTTTTGTGGSLTSTALGDSLELVCMAANTDWSVLSSMGNITVV